MERRSFLKSVIGGVSLAMLVAGCDEKKDTKDIKSEYNYFSRVGDYDVEMVSYGLPHINSVDKTLKLKAKNPDIIPNRIIAHYGWGTQNQIFIKERVGFSRDKENRLIYSESGLYKILLHQPEIGVGDSQKEYTLCEVNGENLVPVIEYLDVEGIKRFPFAWEKSSSLFPKAQYSEGGMQDISILNLKEGTRKTADQTYQKIIKTYSRDRIKALDSLIKDAIRKVRK